MANSTLRATVVFLLSCGCPLAAEAAGRAKEPHPFDAGYILSSRVICCGVVEKITWQPSQSWYVPGTCVLRVTRGFRGAKVGDRLALNVARVPPASRRPHPVWKRTHVKVGQTLLVLIGRRLRAKEGVEIVREIPGIDHPLLTELQGAVDIESVPEAKRFPLVRKVLSAGRLPSSLLVHYCIYRAERLPETASKGAMLLRDVVATKENDPDVRSSALSALGRVMAATLDRTEGRPWLSQAGLLLSLAPAIPLSNDYFLDAYTWALWTRLPPSPEPSRESMQWRLWVTLLPDELKGKPLDPPVQAGDLKLKSPVETVRGLRTIGKRLADRIRSANLELKILRASGSGVVPPYKIQTLTRTIRTQTQRREFVERLAGALEKFLAAKGQETRR